jgi:Cu/Ag efflux protein CusF
MGNIMRLPLIIACALFNAAAVAQTVTPSDHNAHHAPPAAGQAAGELAEGEVRRVDRDAQKVTLRHGPLPNLGMSDPMTMVFRVSDPKMLEGVKAGDKVRFKADKVGGQYTVTEMVPAD